jgi:hypothetical protein
LQIKEPVALPITNFYCYESTDILCFDANIEKMNHENDAIFPLYEATAKLKQRETFFFLPISLAFEYYIISIYKMEQRER